MVPADCILLERQQRVIAFNESLRRHCEAAGVEYYDCFEEMYAACHPHPIRPRPPAFLPRGRCEFLRASVRRYDASTCRLRPEYVDLSEYNIHVIWETTIALWLPNLIYGT